MIETFSTQSRVLGCFLGGAVGDALGAPIEFMYLEAIQDKYGAEGLADYDEAYGRQGAITDDTQMSLFTAEGLIRAQVHWKGEEGNYHLKSEIKNAYLRWLLTQGKSYPAIEKWGKEILSNGWLFTNEVLHHQRAPGNTVMSELLNSDRGIRGFRGVFHFAFNDSKGCGGVMRVAPIGLSALDAYGLAADAAHITHGHPTGYISAGAFSLIIHGIMVGESLRDSVKRCLSFLKTEPNHEETVAAIEKAVEMGKTSDLTPENIEHLGAGWVAEEALSIGLFCALKAKDFSSGVLAAVNHSGDSDSTGSICGNLLGTILGVEAIPKKWIEELEAREVIEQLAHDFIHTFICDDEKAMCNWDRYPGN